MITEFKINVADVSHFSQRRDKLRSMLDAGYSQICVAYSLWDSHEPNGYAEALLIGETLFEFCKSIFPIHVYQPGFTPTDHVVFIIQIRNLDGFVDKLLSLGTLFDGEVADRQSERAHAVNVLIHDLDTRELHFPELRDLFNAPSRGANALVRE